MMVATKVGVLAVDAKILLPPLTPVSLQITDIQPPGATLIEKDPLPSFRTSWTILAHALETLEQTDAAAAEAVKRILPQAGNRLPALMMSYVQAAVQGQSFASWLGEANVAALRKTGTKGENILRRLEKEFSASGKKATDGRTSWRGIFSRGRACFPFSPTAARRKCSFPLGGDSRKIRRPFCAGHESDPPGTYADGRSRLP